MRHRARAPRRSQPDAARGSAVRLRLVDLAQAVPARQAQAQDLSRVHDSTALGPPYLTAMIPRLSLVPIERDGTPRGLEGSLPPGLDEVLRATRDLYERAGFEKPWIGYLAALDDAVVGTCGFKSP